MRRDQGRLADSERRIREALSIRRGALASGHRDIGEALAELGETLTRRGRFGEAEEALAESHTLLLAAEGEGSGRVRSVRARADALYAAWRRADGARRIPSATPAAGVPVAPDSAGAASPSVR